MYSTTITIVMIITTIRRMSRPILPTGECQPVRCDNTNIYIYIYIYIHTHVYTYVCTYIYK